MSLSSLDVDAKGARIMTDILTGGYLRQRIEQIYTLPIPSQIQTLCFMYWFIKGLDEWDVEMCKDDNVKFNGQIVKVRNCTRSIYGRNSVSSGQYEWKLRLINDKSISYSFNDGEYKTADIKAALE